MEPRRLLSAAPWIIAGDDRAGATADVIVVEQHPVTEALLQVTVNGRIVGTRPITAPGAIHIHGGLGDDEIRVAVPGLRAGLVLHGGPGDDRIDGGPGADLITGGRGDDTLAGGGGNDRIHGERGEDVLLGEAGNDLLGGGGGVDTLVAGAGRDVLRGGVGADRVFGAVGSDLLGGDPEDRFTQSKLARPIVQATGEAELRRALRRVNAGRGQWLDSMVLRGQPLSSTTASPGGSAVADHSGTNNQVAGVEEADLVKTDGQHIYTIVGNELLVIDADPASLAVVSRTTIEGYASGLFLDGGRVTVVATRWLWDGWVRPAGSEPLPGDAVAASPVAVTSIGRIVPPWSRTIETVVTVLDMADPSAPALVERTTLEGSLITAREIEGNVYVVVDNRDGLRAMAAGGPLPTFLATAGVHVALGGDDDGSLVTIARLSPLDDEPGIDDAAVMVGMGGTVYASENAIYLAASDWSGDGMMTEITSFSLGEEIDLLASGSVPGYVPDQFAMDEHADGTFRIATQVGWGRDASSSVHVLGRRGGELAILGGVSGIAPRESLMATRFIGDQAYVVTFEQVDPLFVIDLSDPTAPRITGELKIPGFSAYLHPMDDGRLFGIGQGDTANTGKLSLFDVSDPTAPAELDTVTLGDGEGWTSSEAAWDHRAFSWFPAEGLLAVPVTTWNWNWEDGRSHNQFVVGVYAVDRETGFTHAFDVSHDSPVVRSLRIGSRLYTLSGSALAIHDLGGAHEELARLSLDDGGGDGVPPVVGEPIVPPGAGGPIVLF